ncbi:asialoglycoprotein receptor 2-like [Saccopteryx bilineata]|uniref:asialoglycoprotein receptor 2-like n=1 Tax=Saccopteryx bilineata TaxID=59482 RepID=UPI00338F34F9
MAQDFQDIQHLDSEENDHPLGTPPSQPLQQQSLCSRLWLSLPVLGFSDLLLMAICVIGSQRTQMQVEFWTLKEAFNNFSSSTLTEIRALGSHGGSIGDSVTSLEARLEKQEQDLESDPSPSHDTSQLICASWLVRWPSCEAMAQNAAPLTGWSMKAAATGSLAPD